MSPRVGLLVANMIYNRPVGLDLIWGYLLHLGRADIVDCLQILVRIVEESSPIR